MIRAFEGDGIGVEPGPWEDGPAFFNAASPARVL